MAHASEQFGDDGTAGGLPRAELAGNPGDAITRAQRENGSSHRSTTTSDAGGWDKRARRRTTTGRPGHGPTGSLSRGDLLSVSEAADFLGVNLRTLYRLIDRNQVPGARRLGRTVVVVRPILERWLLTGETGVVDA